jgi:hypothetical protein
MARQLPWNVAHQHCDHTRSGTQSRFHRDRSCLRVPSCCSLTEPLSHMAGHCTLLHACPGRHLCCNGCSTGKSRSHAAPICPQQCPQGAVTCIRKSKYHDTTENSVVGAHSCPHQHYALCKFGNASRAHVAVSAQLVATSFILH